MVLLTFPSWIRILIAVFEHQRGSEWCFLRFKYHSIKEDDSCISADTWVLCCNKCLALAPFAWEIKNWMAGVRGTNGATSILPDLSLALIHNRGVVVCWVTRVWGGSHEMIYCKITHNTGSHHFEQFKFREIFFGGHKMPTLRLTQSEA